MAPQIVVYTARSVITMDPGRPRADAVAVMDGRVLSTGTVESMGPWLERYDHRIDDRFKDAVITPGFIDPHTHFEMSSGYLGVPYVGPIESPGPCGTNPAHPTRESVLEELASLNTSTPEGETIVAWGLDPAIQGGHLHRDELDAVVPDHPLFVISYAPHFLYANSRALALTPLTDDSTSEGVGKYDDGRLNGQFIEMAAHKAAVGKSAADLVDDAGEAGLRRMADVGVAGGVTTTAEMLFGLTDPDREWRIHDAVFNAPNPAMRMALVYSSMTLHDDHGADAAAHLAEQYARNSDSLFFAGVKFLADGSFPAMSSRTRWPGYLDLTNGVENDVPWTELAERMRPYWEAGIPIHCHANGDETIDATLDALAQLQAWRPRFDHRFTFEHYCLSTPDQARRLAVLGALASVNIYYVHYRSHIHREQAYGPDRAEALGRVGSLARERVPFALHSDFSLVGVPMKPLTAAWIAVNRIAQDGSTVFAPGERISVDAALHAITTDAAYVLGQERVLGSLEPGKFADFAILDKDPYEVAPEELRDIEVLGTVVGGVVHGALA
ncbi:amidohydrolase [Microbacterium paraoxydans]|uniref:amidohydrolase n=1 Tax=Microbacterium paraoxydans TaxID=199592 RepID=UPI001CFA872F|nr:amidohydrolase [Microbacterium paraoxydans]